MIHCKSKTFVYVQLNIDLPSIVQMIESLVFGLTILVTIILRKFGFISHCFRYFGTLCVATDDINASSNEACHMQLQTMIASCLTVWNKP